MKDPESSESKEMAIILIAVREIGVSELSKPNSCSHVTRRTSQQHRIKGSLNWAPTLGQQMFDFP